MLLLNSFQYCLTSTNVESVFSLKIYNSTAECYPAKEMD